MTNEDKKFEQYVESLRFDDAPSTEHREKLEQQLLNAYDERGEQVNDDAPIAEPTRLYVQRLAMAASFLLVCGLSFWAIDTFYIRTAPPYINDPVIVKLLEEEPTKADQKRLLARVKNIWQMIHDEDAEGLVSVVQSDDITRTLRVWTAKYLGRFGDVDTLSLLDETIDQMKITDPNDPLKIAAAKIRKRLETENKANTGDDE